MHWLESTRPHFICCVKPNNKQVPGTYQVDLVSQQLRCFGILEVVRISRSGYPTRIQHQDFAGRWVEDISVICLLSFSFLLWINKYFTKTKCLEDSLVIFHSLSITWMTKLSLLMCLFVCRYGLLVSKTTVAQDPLSVSIAVLQQFGILPEMYQIGYTKVFLRSGQVNYFLFL